MAARQGGSVGEWLLGSSAPRSQARLGNAGCEALLRVGSDTGSRASRRRSQAELGNEEGGGEETRSGILLRPSTLLFCYRTGIPSPPIRLRKAVMLVVMKTDATAEQVEQVVAAIRRMNLTPH